MSMESAKLFLERVKSDEDFVQKVHQCKDTEERMAFVKTEGFDFTEREIKEVTAELSDDELERINGGGGIECFLTFHFLN